jgi:hypothetical protein
MYKHNLLTPVRYARVGGFDYPSTSSGTASESTPNFLGLG